MISIQNHSNLCLHEYYVNCLIIILQYNSLKASWFLYSLGSSSNLSPSINRTYDGMIFIYLKPHLHIFHISCLVEWSSELTKTTRERISHRLPISTSSPITSLWARAPSQAACPMSTWEGYTPSMFLFVPCASLQCPSVDYNNSENKQMNRIIIASVNDEIMCCS